MIYAAKGWRFRREGNGDVFVEVPPGDITQRFPAEIWARIVHGVAHPRTHYGLVSAMHGVPTAAYLTDIE